MLTKGDIYLQQVQINTQNLYYKHPGSTQGNKLNEKRKHELPSKDAKCIMR